MLWYLYIATYIQYNSFLTPELLHEKKAYYEYKTESGCNRARMRETGPVAHNDPRLAAKWTVARCEPVVINL